MKGMSSNKKWTLFDHTYYAYCYFCCLLHWLLIIKSNVFAGMVNKLKYKEIQDEIQDVSRALRESTNNLVRSLKENPNISGNLIKVS